MSGVPQAKARGWKQTSESSSNALLDIDSAADFLDTSVRHMRRMISQRRVPYYKVGRFVRFKASDLEHWLEDQRVEAIGYGDP